MRGRRLSRTANIPIPNAYVLMLDGEFSQWALNEDRAVQTKGRWREIFGVSAEMPLDLEIGTGNGFHFAHYAQNNPQRCFLGLELKYKPLIQSIRRAVRTGATNARIARYNAASMAELFVEGELNNVFIHFPDPWPRKKQWKHRLITTEFLNELYRFQRLGSFVEFKTDNRDYFDWTVERAKPTPYTQEFLSYDLHRSERQHTNFLTHFEKLFLKQGLPIHSLVLRK